MKIKAVLWALIISTTLNIGMGCKSLAANIMNEDDMEIEWNSYNGEQNV